MFSTLLPTLVFSFLSFTFPGGQVFWSHILAGLDSRAMSSALKYLIQIPEGQTGNYLAVGAACLTVLLVVFALLTKPSKDAPPEVGGKVPIFGHIFRFVKSPLNLVSW